MTTKLLLATQVLPAGLGAYVGYRFYAFVPNDVGNERRLVTIAAVRKDGDDWLVELAEYPGYHVIRREPTDLWANVAPTPDPVKRVDLIDRDGSRWIDQGDGGYRSFSSAPTVTRDHIERRYGPVHEAS